MADLWPNEPLRVAWSADAFVHPLANLGLGLALAVVVRGGPAAVSAARLGLGPAGGRRGRRSRRGPIGRRRGRDLRLGASVGRPRAGRSDGPAPGGPGGDRRAPL